jgi:hypothetical protein
LSAFPVSQWLLLDKDVPSQRRDRARFALASLKTNIYSNMFILSAMIIFVNIIDKKSGGDYYVRIWISNKRKQEGL